MYQVLIQRVLHPYIRLLNISASDLVGRFPALAMDALRVIFHSGHPKRMEGQARHGTHSQRLDRISNRYL
jgi:hypothetical protein